MTDLDKAIAAGARAGVAVSRETAERLALYVALLRQWNPAKNLVSASTLDAVWDRHVADCLQLAALSPARHWVDMGSGGGLPGLILAAILAERGGTIHCVESKLGKAAFLREAARQMQVPATIHAARIEAVMEDWPAGRPVEVVTARALAPLPKLLSLSKSLLKKGALGLFPKGQDAANELTDAAQYWIFNHDLRPSVTDSAARIVLITDLAERPHSVSGASS